MCKFYQGLLVSNLLAGYHTNVLLSKGVWLLVCSFNSAWLRCSSFSLTFSIFYLCHGSFLLWVLTFLMDLEKRWSISTNIIFAPLLGMIPTMRNLAVWLIASEVTLLREVCFSYRYRGFSDIRKIGFWWCSIEIILWISHSLRSCLRSGSAGCQTLHLRLVSESVTVRTVSTSYSI